MERHYLCSGSLLEVVDTSNQQRGLSPQSHRSLTGTPDTSVTKVSAMRHTSGWSVSMRPAGRSTIALTGRLRSTAPWSAVVVLTLRDDVATRERAGAAGAASFAAKHRTEEILVATIRGVAQARQRRHGRLSECTEEEYGHDMHHRRGA
jgi:DNA-binding NarL/FixJ family response regulator